MSFLESIETYAGRLATFEVPHRLPNRRASASKKKGVATTTWPATAPPAEEMARAGFWYKPVPTNPDNARCFVCGTELDGWEPEDDPVTEHITHSPHCGWAIHANVRSKLLRGDIIERDPMELEMMEARKVTFLGKWPHEGKKGWKPKVQKLVDAGWCYDPSPEADDGSTCFYCNLSLDGWEPKDDPWNEHKKRSPNCPFLEFAERAKANKPKKGRKGRTSTASKTSRLSTQSNRTLLTESSSLMELDDMPPGDEDSVLTTATSTTTTSKAGRTRKVSARGRSSTKGATNTRKGTRGKKTSVLEAEPSQTDIDLMVLELGPPDAEATPEPPRKIARTKYVQSQFTNNSTIDSGPSALSQTTQESLFHTGQSTRLSEDQAQIHSEIAAYEASLISLHSVESPSTVQRGVKRSSDGSVKGNEVELSRDGATQPKQKPLAKSKKGTKGKKANKDLASNELESATSAGEQAQDHSKKIQAKDPELLQQKPDAPSSPPQLPPAARSLSPNMLETSTPSPQRLSSASPLPPTPTPAKIAPASLHRSSPVRPRTSNVIVHQDRTPSASPQSSDAENIPPSSRRPTSARRPLAALSSNPRTIQVTLAGSTPTASPSKRNLIGGLKSTQTWQAADLENIFLPSPPSKSVGRSSGFGFGNAANLSQRERETLAALDQFAADNINCDELKLDEVVRKVKAALTSPEKRMSVETWVSYNAKRGEERLRGECERLVSIFEREGGRALRTLEGLECQP